MHLTPSYSSSFQTPPRAGKGSVPAGESGLGSGGGGAREPRRWMEAPWQKPQMWGEGSVQKQGL